MSSDPRYELAVSGLAPAPVAAPSAAPGLGQNLWRVMDGRLRGHWKRAFAAGILLAGGLSSAAYFMIEPKYQSTGFIQIKAYIQPIIDRSDNGQIPLYHSYVQTQVQLIQSRPVLDEALKSEGMKLVPWARQPDAINRLARGLEVEIERNSELVQLSFEGDTAREAQAVVQAVIEAYQETIIQGSSDSMAFKDGALNTLKNKHESELKENKQRIKDLFKTSPTGAGDPVQFLSTRMARIDELEVSLRNLLEESAGLPGAEAGVGGAPAAEPTELELIAFDKAFEKAAEEQAVAQLAFDQVNRDLRPGHPGWRRAEENLQYANDRFAEQHAVARAAFLAARAGGLVAPPRGRGEIEAEMALVQQEIKVHQGVIQKMTADHQELQDLQREQERISNSISMVNDRISVLDAERGGGASRIEVRDYGDLPLAPSQDRRRKLALLGAAGGFALSFGFFFLVGTFDRRAYSVAQLRDPAHGLRCLGVLPDLSQGRLDPESCAVAAHCVHQIRNQIEALRLADRAMVLAVSSAYQGDGKTSIVMALGGSYAAAGYRTVLIDCDLVSRSLTGQLGKAGFPGLREALRHRQLNGLAVPAGAPNLSILPAGLDPTFGAEDIRRIDVEAVFRQLRQSFDMIIVDTGPMGSLEGLPVTASADGVLLSVRRGRRQPRVEECVQMLRSAGGTCLGIVLNCAASSDCNRYVSKSTISVAAGQGGDARGAAAALVQAMNLASSPAAPDEPRPAEGGQS